MLGTLHNQFGFKTQSKTVYCGIYFDSRKGGCGKALLRDLKAFLSQGVIWGDGTNVTTSTCRPRCEDHHIDQGRGPWFWRTEFPLALLKPSLGWFAKHESHVQKLRSGSFPLKMGYRGVSQAKDIFFLGVKVFRGLQGATTHPVPAGPSLCTHNPGDRCSWTHEIRHLQLIPRSI